MASAGTTVALVAEAAGTFAVMLVSCASCGGMAYDFGPTAVGFVYMALIYSLSGISGAHLNPAVTFASALAKKFPWWTTLYYVIAQLIGGMLGGITYNMMFGVPAKFVAQGTSTWWQVLIVECFFTAMLAYVVLSVTSLRNLNFNQYYALATGFVLIAAGHASLKVSGAAINPAVSLGAGLTGDMSLLLSGAIYIHWQFLGSIIAALVFAATRPEDYMTEDRVVSYAPALLTSLAGEWIGTFMIAFTYGCSVMANNGGATAWATGAAVLSMLYALGDVSGGNFNPAITLAAGLCRRGCSFFEGASYAFVQLVAAFLGAMAACGVYSSGFTVGAVAPFGAGPALVLELLFTTVVGYVFLNTVCIKNIATPLSRNYFFGLAVGLSVAAGIFASGNVSGGYLNPAMSLAFGITGAMTSGSAAGFLTCMGYVFIELLGGLIACGLFYAAQAGAYATTGKAL